MNGQPSVRLDAHEFGKKPVAEKYTVDVKYTGHQNGMLCADLETKGRGVCDLYALMFGLYPTVYVQGLHPWRTVHQGRKCKRSVREARVCDRS